MSADWPDPDCRTCEGDGEVRHPSWGSPECPAPTMPCPVCCPQVAQWEVPR